MNAEPAAEQPGIRFGAFEFDRRRQELRRQGFLIKLPAAQLRLLNLFLERPGELITRDEITAHLWVDPSNIDVSNGINTTINRLRSNLNDPHDSAECIETVIGLGYRFVSHLAADPPADLTQPQPAAPEAVLPEDPQSHHPEVTALPRIPPQPSPQARRRWVAMYLALFLLIAGGFLLLRIAGNQRTARALPSSMPSPSSFHLHPVTFNTPGETISAVAVSPDGKAVAFGNRAGVSIHWFGGSDQLLPSRPFFQVCAVSWFPKATGLLMSGTDTQTHRRQVWEWHLSEGYLRLFLDDADLASISRDGKLVAFTRQSNKEIWVADEDGKNPRKLLTDAQGSFPHLTWSSNGDHLLVDHRGISPDTDTYQSIDAQSGSVLAQETGIAFTSGYVLDDGRFFFPVTASANPAAGKTELMMVHTDPRTGRLLDKPQLQQVFGGYGTALSASLDGTRIALQLDYSTVNAFVADLHQPGSTLDNVKELPHQVEESYPHAFTPDGQSVILENSSLGTWAIFQQPVDGTASRLVARPSLQAAMAQISADGRWIMFLQFPSTTAPPSGVFRIPLAGGVVSQVPTTGQIEDFRCPISAGGACVLREPIGNTELVYYALDPVSGIGRELARTPWHPIVLGDWGLSPDGSIVSVTDHDLAHPTLALLPLAGSKASGPSSIPLNGHGTLLGSSWAADGHSLFVQCRTRDGFELVNLDLTGHATLLRKSSVPLWGIPSRDGMKIAFPDRTSASNVWASDTPGH